MLWRFIHVAVATLLRPVTIKENVIAWALPLDGMYWPHTSNNNMPKPEGCTTSWVPLSDASYFISPHIDYPTIVIHPEMYYVNHYYWSLWTLLRRDVPCREKRSTGSFTTRHIVHLTYHFTALFGIYIRFIHVTSASTTGFATCFNKYLREQEICTTLSLYYQRYCSPNISLQYVNAHTYAAATWHPQHTIKEKFIAWALLLDGEF